MASNDSDSIRVSVPVRKASSVCSPLVRFSMVWVLHYDVAGQSDVAKITGEGNTEFLRSGRRLSTITPLEISDIKRYLRSHAIPCRHELDGTSAK